MDYTWLGGDGSSIALVTPKKERLKMELFITLFIAVAVLMTLLLSALAIANRLRANRPGCSGNHECVTFNGEKIECPACELRESMKQSNTAECEKACKS